MSAAPRVVEGAGGLGLRGAVVCIGAFDGVHLGHRMLLGRMRDEAAARGCPAVVITFFPPPKSVFGGAPYLSGPEEKVALLAEYAPDAVVMVPFSPAYARTPKDAFLAELAALEPAVVVVGEDFRFGADRAGGLDDLQHATEQLVAYRMRELEGEPVKSSRIRELLGAGDVTGAEELLGAPYRARGRVVEGDRRGRAIGVPTANLDVPAGKALPLGVFAVEVEIEGSEGLRPGMANVGPRPSFPDGAPSLEAHLFDFDGDLYGAWATVRFRARLRGQERFASLEALKEQLRRDEAAARAALAALPAPAPAR